VSRVNDSYIQANLTKSLERNITVSTSIASIAYTDPSCSKFYSTEVAIVGLGTLRMFVSSKRVHMKINGPDRWFGLGFGSIMLNSDSVIFDGNDKVFDTILGDDSAGYLDEEIDNLERVELTTESDGGFTVDFWRDRDTGDVEGDKVIPCTDRIQMIWAKGTYRWEQIPSWGHLEPNSGTVSVQFSELVSISAEIDMNDAIEDLTRETIEHIHAWIMIIAWLLLVPIGVLSMTFRRIFYAPGRPLASRGDEGCLTNMFWFNMHRSLNIVAVTFTLVGVYLGTTIAGEKHFTDPHGMIGLTVLVLSVIQVIIGTFRPNKKNVSRRKIWAMIHRSLGVKLFVMAVFNMYIQDASNIYLVYAAIVLLSPLCEFAFVKKVPKDTVLLEVEME